MKICFIDYTTFSYDSNSTYNQNLRGAESVIINLSNALNNLGYNVTVINNCQQDTIINGIRWFNINKIRKIENFDLVIANGDSRLFKYAISKNYISSSGALLCL